MTETISKFRHSCNPYVARAHEIQRIQGTPEIFQHISSDGPIFLEVGCSHGTTLRKMGSEFPEALIIGNDYKYKEVVISAERCENLSNVWLAKSSIEKLIQDSPENYFDGIMSFYPDPWPKRRQQKNRIWKESFLEALFPKLKNGAFVFLKTDQFDYYEQMKQGLFENKFFAPIFWGEYTKDSYLFDEVFSSFFERLFFSQQGKSYFIFGRTVK